jgi:hypothetical protein
MVLSLGVAIFQYQAKMEARARIAEVEAHTDSLLVTIADRNEELDSVYVALDSVVAKADSVIAASKLREDQAYRRARHTADDLREALANDEELTAMLNSLTASYEATIDALRIQVVELERVRDEQGNVIDLQKIQLADYAEAVEGLQTLAGPAEDRRGDRWRASDRDPDLTVRGSHVQIAGPLDRQAGHRAGPPEHKGRRRGNRCT